MAGWVTLELPDIESVGHPSALKKAFDADDAAALRRTFDRFRATIVADIRAAVATANPMGLDKAELTIPPEWVWYAALWCYEKLMGRIGASSGGANSAFQLTEDQRTELTAGREKLQRVAEGKLAVTLPEQPVDDVTMQQPTVSPAMVTATRRFTWDQQDGI